MEITEKELELGFGSATVILVKSLVHSGSSSLYCDNYFTNVNLFIYLHEKMNVYVTGTFRKNRIKKYPLKSDKALEKEGRGSMHFKSFENMFIIVKFLDNKVVHYYGSIYARWHQLLNILKRYSKEHKKRFIY